MKVGEDFVGYELADYTIDARPDGGIRIRFSSATIKKDGKALRVAHPRVPLFQLPSDARYARLLFLTRVSPADHDQGVIAAPTISELQALTAKVQADPGHTCSENAQAFCSWIPIGIAVQPEKRSTGFKKAWVPAT